MTKAKIGRPTKYNGKLADKICNQLSDGDSLRTVCSADDMPCKTTVLMWLRTNEEFLNQYARAKQESADAHTDDMLDIADDASNDWMVRHGKDDEESWQLNGEHIQRSRLRIDTRKWLASKLQPKKYGERIVNEHTGSINFTKLTDDELETKKRQAEQALKQSTKD